MPDIPEMSRCLVLVIVSESFLNLTVLIIILTHYRTTITPLYIYFFLFQFQGQFQFIVPNSTAPILISIDMSNIENIVKIQVHQWYH